MLLENGGKNNDDGDNDGYYGEFGLDNSVN